MIPAARSAWDESGIRRGRVGMFGLFPISFPVAGAAREATVPEAEALRFGWPQFAGPY